ncbi:unnamed protein product [Arabis nemorensis]|uniref:U-box domain-containing protein n=1 Tax=Arabis nemorensis TaxID=586526 RepID=A0A565BKI5_9BRAS|nr:unnamed protein product [Arabis nemorensis]
MESGNNDKIKLEEALSREKEKLEKLLLECYEDEQAKWHLQAKALEQMHQEKLRRLWEEIGYVLWEEIENVRAIDREKLEKVKWELEAFKIRHGLVEGHVEVYKRDVNAMREERDNALKLVHEITTKHENMCLKAEHENMCLKAEEFESKYKSELILTEALMKEKQEITTKDENMYLMAEKLESELNLTKVLLIKAKQELEISYSTKDADAMRKERDNAIKFVNEITTKKQEVMKDPHVTSDGFTYEAESIRAWFSTGKHTSPMTNLKLSHTNLVPNRALRSAIQELV